MTLKEIHDIMQHVGCTFTNFDLPEEGYCSIMRGLDELEDDHADEWEDTCEP